MYITLESDYAIRIVYFISKQDKRVDAKTIAENTSVSLRFSLKILRQLANNGILKSFKGANGGYEINRPLDLISLNDVIETIEGVYTLNRCTRSDFVCNKHLNYDCKFNEIFKEISEIVIEKMKSVKFSDIE
ncbi:MAG: Rrf2 family transcriptional regulator [Oscillospiraceae bacterium]